MISYDGWDREYLEHRDEYLNLFDKFMSQSNYENNEEFEKKFAKRIGRKHCVSVANATDALHFSLLAHDIGPGDEVFVTDFSWISSASCVDMVGATPVFCDIDLDSYHMSLDSIKRMYNDKVKAIVYPHLFGNMTDTLEIQKFCREKNVLFIEDAAQSLGSSLNGVRAGTIGDTSVFSFNSNKVIAGINGGGVILTDDNNIAKRVKTIRRHGRDKTFDILGYNSRMYVLNAQIIDLRLQRLNQYQEKRQEIAKKYNNAFKDLELRIQLPIQGLNHNYHKYTIRCKNKEIRKKLKNALNASVHYETPLSLNIMYNKKKYRKDTCINSKLVSETILSLPIHPWLSVDEINYIIKTVRDHVK
jgi:perosamine synthetase